MNMDSSIPKPVHRRSSVREKRRTTRLPWLSTRSTGTNHSKMLSPIPGSFEIPDTQSLLSDGADSPLSINKLSSTAMFDKTNTPPQNYQRRILIRGPSGDGNASSSSMRRSEHPMSSTDQSYTDESLPQSPLTVPNRAPPAPPEAETSLSRPGIPLARLAQDLRLTSSSISMRPDAPPTSGEAITQSAGDHDQPTIIRSARGSEIEAPVARHARQGHQQRSDAEVMDDAVQASITGLGTRLDEADYLARDASRGNRPEEVSIILEEAARALEQSTNVENRQARANRGSLVDAGGAVPWSSISHDHTEDGSTFSESSSIQDDTDMGPRSTVLERNVVAPGADLNQEHRTIARGPVAVDWAYQSALRRHDDSTRSPQMNAVRRRSTRARFDMPPETYELQEVHPSTSSGNVDGREDPSRPDQARDFPRHPLLAAEPLQDSVHASPTNAAATVMPRRNSTPTLGQIGGENWGRDKYDERDYLSSSALKGKRHITLRDDQKWSLHHHKRQPIARNWDVSRKRFTATVACINTALIGIVVGIYAGEVPAIQYAMTDLHHQVILGNVLLYIGMAITTFLFWPLPLLHGRKPYTLVALGIALPLQFPQAVMVMNRRFGNNGKYMAGLLISRALSGIALGVAHINFRSTLLDLFGASLQSTHPHGEIVVVDDVRRHGGGMGLWLGIWSLCSIGSIALGFLIGALIVSGLNVAWGFYVTVILIASVLFLNVIAPETRRAAHRRTMSEIEMPNMSITRRVARGEIKMHVSGDGPKWWWEEVFAGILLSFKMLDQPGFGVMALYLGWVYGEIVLVIVLLGNLLSVRYEWRPEYVGLGVFSIAIGAALAIPNTKANFFSKSRSHPFRTDSMTFQPRITWTSHMVRRAAFMIILPLAGIAYTLASAGRYVQYMVPIIFAGLIGYVSNLAIAECHGLIMEAFDTSDLQPGVNSRHRLQSLSPAILRRRTTYSSYPRVTAGFFVSQTIGFLLAAIATGVGGILTRQVGAQKATGITAGILFGLTVLLTMALWRYKSVQVIPNQLFSDNFGATESDKRHSMASMQSDKSWRAVIVGNPSGKIRRMNLLELGGLSRWTEIRRLNRLLDRTTTQGLNPGWR